MVRGSGETSQVVTGVGEEIPIPSRATTSRALLDNEQVRVVSFAFGVGERLTEHTATEAVVVQLIEGRLHFEVQGASHELEPGDCVYLAPGEPHALAAVAPSRVSLVLIHRAG